MNAERLGRRIVYTLVIGGILLAALWDVATYRKPYYEIERFESTGGCAVHRITDGPEIGEDEDELVFVGSCDKARKKYPKADLRD
jgi:hypothetical protein